MKGGDDGRTKGNTKDDDDDEDNIHDDDSIDVDSPNEPLVAVFGEIVEDPTLFQGHLDDDKESRNGGSGVGGECHDPAIVRENVKRLNRDVLHGFLALVRKLAEDDPSDHRCVVIRCGVFNKVSRVFVGDPFLSVVVVVGCIPGFERV